MIFEISFPTHFVERLVMARKGNSRRGASNSFSAALAAQQDRKAAEAAAARAAANPANQQPALKPGYSAQDCYRKHSFWLTQRLESRKEPRSEGAVTRFFEPDYMGSSEFEFGALGRSFRRIQEVGNIIIVPRDITYRDVARTIFFVGPSDDIDDKIAAFTVWLLEKGLIAKELTNFEEVFLGDHLTGLYKEWWDEGHYRTDAWWSFACDLSWTLDPTLAENLLAGFKTQVN